MKKCIDRKRIKNELIYDKIYSERICFPLQLFAVLFFVMMFVLGVGSIVGMVSAVVSALKEKLPNVTIWKIVVSVCLMGFAVSTVYVTPVCNSKNLDFLSLELNCS